ncbi:MAG: ATP-dependent RNA helicase HrpA, partial [Pseudomonadota bacterium]|nr:ATP-dependent RNA helicase HrpA [Pseudomonadota bacterium]
MKQNSSAFQRTLDTCMIRDRFKLNRQWQQHGMSKRLDQRLQESKALADQRRENAPAVRYPEILPVSDRVDDIKQAICDHQVIILAGETGSGKTTQIPKICLDLGRGIYGTIGHTQPRRVAVRTVSARLAEEMDVTLGEQVGYQIRFSDRSKAISQVKVMTDGVLLAETQHDRFLENYDTLIIDEAHERSLNIDFLIGYIKRILPKRPDLKIIITSATIDLDRFSDHFKQAPVIEVSGRTYPVEVCYRPLVDQEKREDSDERMYKGVLNALDEIRVLERAQGSPGGVLIFLSGEREIRELALLIKRSSQFKGELLPLYGRLSNSEQNRVFAPVRQSRIVLATNVAETSLTVPGIRYVIDTGLARISRYSVNSKVQRLPVEPISRASAEQRKGRCGRVSAGVCFRLYSEEDFLARPEFTTPEILRTNLAAVLLQMLKLRLGDAAKFPFIERPEQRQVNDGFMLLHELAAVDDRRALSKTGRQIAEFPIDLRLARIILEARRFGCLTEILVIVSALSIQDPRERPQDAQQKADLRHRVWRHEQSDFMDYWNLWVEYEALRQESTQGQLRRYCRANFLSFLRMREWR